MITILASTYQHFLEYENAPISVDDYYSHVL